MHKNTLAFQSNILKKHFTQQKWPIMVGINNRCFARKVMGNKEMLA